MRRAWVLLALLACTGCPGYGKAPGISSMNSEGDKAPAGLNHLNVGYDEDDQKEEKFWKGFYGDDHSVKGDCEFYGNCVAKDSALGW